MKGAYKRRTNHDCWARLDTAAQIHEVTYEWIKGHNGNTEQEAADTIARSIAEIGEVTELILTEAVQRLENVITPALPNAVSEGLQYLANDCDGARTRDGVGFSKFDADFGTASQQKQFSTLASRRRQKASRVRGHLGYNPARRHTLETSIRRTEKEGGIHETDFNFSRSMP
jgi:hypothetical protein